MYIIYIHILFKYAYLKYYVYTYYYTTIIIYYYLYIYIYIWFQFSTLKRLKWSRGAKTGRRLRRSRRCTARPFWAWRRRWSRCSRSHGSSRRRQNNDVLQGREHDYQRVYIWIWLVVWNHEWIMTFHSVGNFMIPTDSYFSEGLVETTNQVMSTPINKLWFSLRGVFPKEWQSDT